MTLWTDIAEWRGPVLHHSSNPIADHMYVVIHTADGSFEGTISWQKNPDADNSSHFVVDVDGKIAQVNDTAIESGAQILGNPFSIAIENAGNENTPLTAAQIEANARILAKAHQVHGIPLQITNRVGTRGLGHHSMGAESGVRWGHSQCPGEIIKAQKPAILARAIQIVAGNVAPEGEDVSFLRAIDGPAAGSIYLAAGGKIVQVSSGDWAKVSPQSFVNVPASLIGAAAAPGLTAAALAAALAPLLPPAAGVSVADLVAAIGSPEVQALLTAGARKAIDARLDDNTDT
jgi:hypothetical protein